MSFIITVATKEGLVMAADSRLTLSFPDPNYSNPNDPNERLRISVPQSDTTRKLLLAQQRIGISTCGDAVIQQTPIAGFIESFILSLPPNISVADTATALLQYCRQIDSNLQTWFHVAGYSERNGVQVTEAWIVGVSDNHTRQIIASGEQGAVWNGELDIINRLFLPVFQNERTFDPATQQVVATGNYTPFPQYAVNLQHLTLQDAVDLAVFAVRTTIDTMRFQARLRTVGGPIDVLVIEPEAARWLQQKELKVP